MATEPKAGAPKKRAASKTNKEVSKTQGERFIETARELGVDESGKAFDRAMKKLAIKKTT